MSKTILFLSISLILGAGGHLLVKEGVSRAGPGLMAFLHPAVMGGVACYFLSMAAWLPYLASKPVAQAVPVAGLTYVLVALGAGVMQNQWLTPHQWGGVLLIGAGLWVLGR